MAKGVNQLPLIGTLLDTPELRYTPGGLAILTAKIAGNHKHDNDRNAAWYHQATLFGKPAEWLSEADPQPGASILVTGRLNYRTWETDDGQRRSTVDINADNIQILDDNHHTHVKDKKDNSRLEQGLNHVTAYGNLTKDIEVRETDTGNRIINGGLAINESYKQGSEWQERAHFLN